MSLFSCYSLSLFLCYLMNQYEYTELYKQSLKILTEMSCSQLMPPQTEVGHTTALALRCLMKLLGGLFNSGQHTHTQPSVRTQKRARNPLFPSKFIFQRGHKGTDH